MTKSELIEKAWKSIPIHNCRVVDRAGAPFDVIDNGRLITRDDFTDILTRLLEAYDAQKPVEGWHLRLADKLLTDKQYIADMPISRESLAALIASHAPKVVDVEKVWEEGTLFLHVCPICNCLISDCTNPTHHETAIAALFTKTQLISAISDSSRAINIEAIWEKLDASHPSLRCDVCGSLAIRPYSRGWCDGHNGPTTASETVTITKEELGNAING